MIRYIILVTICYCAVESAKVCYESLNNECFYDDYPFGGSFQRPLSTLPESPEKIATKFMLYTRKNQKTADIIRYDSIGRHYDPKKPTKFIVHGFLHDAVQPWVLGMKDNFLSAGDYNVIAVDWSKGNRYLYTQATANTQIVGAEIARFVNTMIDKHGASAADFHVIGHSLGSHIAGYAGERINRLGRITGLDPAGPYFENTPPQVRLDPSDAVFVDVIHSDGTANLKLGLGLMQALGHVDFYPNGGKDQPECPATSGKVLYAIFNAITLDVDGFEESVVCSHMAAVYFFSDTIINKDCSYNGYKCVSHNVFNTGECLQCSTQGCNRMGYWASPDRELGSLWLNTRPPLSKNFCQQHFGVSMGSGNIKGQNQAYGEFTIYFKSQSGARSTTEYLDNYQKTFKKSTIENRLVSLETPFNEEITLVGIYYKRTSNWASWWLYDDQWSFEFVTVNIGDSQRKTLFCQPRVIKSGETVEFYKCG